MDLRKMRTAFFSLEIQELVRLLNLLARCYVCHASKTSLSKRLCNGWASKSWGSEFEQVYLLPIRTLTSDRLQTGKTLEEAITHLLFNAGRKSEDEQSALHHQITDELVEKTTLLLLDGLDEASDNSIADEIINDALSRSCSILVLSRPHSLGAVRSKMDIQIECLGLNEDQLKAYVQREASATSEELIHFLKKSALVWETAKVPVNVQILCTIWKSEEGQRMKELKSVNLKAIYSSMMEYAWQRFEDKTSESVDRQSLFSSLETIAFKAISQGKVEIPRDLVMKHSQGTITRRLLLNSGFLLFREEGQVFEFAHLSFQEFFAGRFLAKNLRGTAKECKKAKQYIAERKYYDTSRVTLSFMTQCYCQEEEDDDEEDCIESLKQLMSILDEKPAEAFGFQQMLLKMRTLDAFLSICGSCAEHIRWDDDLHEVLQFAMKALERWSKEQSTHKSNVFMPRTIHAVFHRFEEDLEQMPNLFSFFPELCCVVLRHCGVVYALENISRIAKFISFAPEQLLHIVPKELQEDVRLDDDYNIKLETWFRLFVHSGPDCAVLALEQLKTACQHQRDYIRKKAYRATTDFFQVLPEREELHSLCHEAIKDRSAFVREEFIYSIGQIKFKPDSVAANLAWSLTVEASRDENERVRDQALRYVFREDQTSEESIEKTIKLLQESMTMHASRSNKTVEQCLLESIRRGVRQFPTKLGAFLPYLANCCKDSDDAAFDSAASVIEDLCSHLPISQMRELGEMITEIYNDVKDREVRARLAAVLFDIGRKIPVFKANFPDVLLQAWEDIVDNVWKQADARIEKHRALIESAESVDAIDKVFWDQLLGAKKELICEIHQKRMINAKTANAVLRMATNCLENADFEIDNEILHFLAYLIQFQTRLSSKTVHRLLCISGSDSYHFVCSIVDSQPVDLLLKHFWDTTDKKVVNTIAKKLMLASVTYQTTRGGKSIVCVMEMGKKTQYAVSTKLVEELILLLKLELHELFRDFLP